MTNAPVLYDNPNFEHADVAVLFCLQVLREQGLTFAAGQLEGISVSCPAMARVALRVLYGIWATGPAAEYVSIARHLCERALTVRSLRAAG